jgi:hypothetical protein
LSDSSPWTESDARPKLGHRIQSEEGLLPRNFARMWKVKQEIRFAPIY